MKVFKKCSIGAEGCEGSYDMELRAQEIKYEVFKFDPPRYDACSNPKCQQIVTNKKKHGKKPKD